MNQYDAGWTTEEIGLLAKHTKKGRNSFQIYLECQKDGMRRSFYSVDSKITKMRREIGTVLRPFKVGYLDIESTGLDSFGDILTWCIKERDGKIEHDMVERNELINYKGDRRVVESLCKAIGTYDQLFTFYGGDYHFDLPMIRTKAVYWKLDFPAYGKVYHQDIWSIAKKKLRFRRNSLAGICEYFSIKGKTPLKHHIWLRGKYGCKKSLNEILRHNKGDVIILEELHKKLENFTAVGRASI